MWSPIQQLLNRSSICVVADWVAFLVLGSVGCGKSLQLYNCLRVDLRNGTTLRIFKSMHSKNATHYLHVHVNETWVAEEGASQLALA